MKIVALALFSSCCFSLLLNGSVCADAADYTLVAEWGESGTAEGQFLEPFGITIDGHGNLFISDPTNHCIQKFTAEGEFLIRWGGYGHEEGQFIAPQGIDLDGDGNIYVADFLNDRIQKFTSEGEFIDAWSTRMNGWWLYSTPRALAVNKDEGCVYVFHASLTPPNLSYTCIQKFTCEGTFVNQWPFIWLDALEMAIDANNHLYVPPTIIGPVQIFNASGDLIDQFTTCPVGNLFCSSTGIALDDQGNIYISDALHHAIRKFKPDGTLITSFVLQGKGGFAAQPSPYGLAIDREGNLYVTDTANDCIKKYAPVATTTTTTIPAGCPVVILYGDDGQITNQLRLFRDTVLNTTPQGRELTRLYYQLSPWFAQTMDNEVIKNELQALISLFLSAL